MKHARELVWQYLSKFSVLRQADKEDLLQECLTHWYFRRDQFDVNKDVKLKTYMSRVMENKLMDIIDKNSRQKRVIFKSTVPLDELLVEGADDLSVYLMVEDMDLEQVFKSDISELLRRAMDQLSFRQKELCRLIKDEGLNIKQASEKMNVPRRTVRDEIVRVKEIFQQEGLRDYL